MDLVREIADRLLERLDYMRIQPRLILVVGLDAAYMSEELKKRYPSANVLNTVEPKTQPVDLVLSNLELYRCENPGDTLQAFSQALKPEGLLLLTTFGPDTFQELSLDRDLFFDMHDIGDSLVHCGLLDPVMDMELITLKYASLPPLTKDLKAFELFDQLNLTKSNGVPSATLELIYGHAWKRPQKNTASLNEQGEAVIPVEAIIKKTDAQWREELTPEQYHITREKGTEAPFSGEYANTTEPGVYHCVCCGATLFESQDKYDAGCGWPSFTQPSDDNVLEERADQSIPGRPRTEVVCHRCDAHLGHVFEDGPGPKGLRYCINSAALKLDKK